MNIKKYMPILATVLLVIVLGTSTVLAAEMDSSDDVNIHEDELIINSNVASDGDAVLLPSEKLLNLDTQKNGKITVRLTEETGGNVGAGVRFYCVKVAEIVNGEYVLEEAYQKSGVELNDIENSVGLEEAAFRLTELIETMDVVQMETNQNGEAVFEKVETGVYLVKAEDNLAYDIICPTLVSVPVWDEKEDVMSYEAVLEPKHTPRPDKSGQEEEPMTAGEYRAAPQTGLKDNTMSYLIAAAICFSSVCFVGIKARISKRGKKR